MKRFIPIVFVLVGLLVVTPLEARAVAIQFYEITTEILDSGLTKNQVKMTFDIPAPTRIDYPIIGQVTDFGWTSNFNTTCDLIGQAIASVITCDLENVTKNTRSLSFNYTANGFVKQLDKNKWLYRFDYQSSVPVITLALTVKLPEGKGLINREDSQTAAGLLPYAPADGDTRTDGRRILVDWARNNFTAGDLLSVSVVYENIQDLAFSNWLPFFAALIIILVAISTYLYLKKSKIIVRTEENLDSVLPVLTSDERKVIDSLLAENGEKMQRKIVYETNFSKAKVSRLINSLKGRGIIGVEERGRTNRVFLLKKPKEPFGTIKPPEDAQNGTKTDDVPKG
ncbi:MAG: hypothetical protein HY516_04745 [Candidatus Aenigmarchaeota archaeon]|nr:hypothetical protein [Candidatus Aenigmarchaeota archaeon]